jgi:RNA polymerase sporulation-specific sigma factor
MLGLIKAAKSFDESRNVKFATFASMCINNQMLMYIRKINRYYGKEVSLYQPVNIDNEGNTLCYADLIAAKGMPQEALPAMMGIEDIIKRQKPRDRRMFITYCKGYNQKEIGKMFGLSQSYVSRIINNLKTQIKKQSV